MQPPLFDKRIVNILLISSIVLISLILLFSFQVHNLESDDERDSWNAVSFFIAGPIAAAISFGNLIVTFIIAYVINEYEHNQKKSRDQEQKKNLILALFTEFRKKESREARIRADKFKTVWNNYPSNTDRKAMVHALIDIKEIALPTKGTQEEILKKEYIFGLYDLLDFYSVLKEYRPEEKSLYEVKFFFYEWWRPFLYEVAIEYEEENKERLNKEAIKKIKNHEAFYNSISFLPTLKAMDELCGFQDLDETMEIYHNTKG